MIFFTLMTCLLVKHTHLLFLLMLIIIGVYILKAIKNATGTSVIFPIKNSLIHFVFVLTSVPNVGERFAQT